MILAVLYGTGFIACLSNAAWARPNNGWYFSPNGITTLTGTGDINPDTSCIASQPCSAKSFTPQVVSAIATLSGGDDARFYLAQGSYGQGMVMTLTGKQSINALGPGIRPILNDNVQTTGSNQINGVEITSSHFDIPIVKATAGALSIINSKLSAHDFVYDIPILGSYGAARVVMSGGEIASQGSPLVGKTCLACSYDESAMQITNVNIIANGGGSGIGVFGQSSINITGGTIKMGNADAYPSRANATFWNENALTLNNVAVDLVQSVSSGSTGVYMPHNTVLTISGGTFDMKVQSGSGHAFVGPASSSPFFNARVLLQGNAKISVKGDSNSSMRGGRLTLRSSTDSVCKVNDVRVSC
jgi:hypothetical protein